MRQRGEAGVRPDRLLGECAGGVARLGGVVAQLTMAHELKHFLRDGKLSYTYCHAANISKPIEVGAEVFAGELLCPEQDFINYMREHCIESECCTPEMSVRMKHETQTTLSYQGPVWRANFFRFAKPELKKNIFGPAVIRAAVQQLLLPAADFGCRRDGEGGPGRRAFREPPASSCQQP